MRAASQPARPASTTLPFVSTDNDTIASEVRTLHDDLANWLGAPDTSEALHRFTTQLHPDFSMVTQEGAVAARAQLVEGLNSAGNAAPGLTIDITDIEILHQSPDSATLRFKEIHHGPGGPTARFTTALLLADPQARNGWLWRTVHETAAS